MTHAMTLTATDSRGRELWECDECGRKTLIGWEPFCRDVLIRGDDQTTHQGGKGGLTMGTPTVEVGP
jgi:hypothetical protein